LLWIDNQIAFVQPENREAYRWNSEVHEAHPEIFSGAKPLSQKQMLAVDFP